MFRAREVVQQQISDDAIASSIAPKAGKSNEKLAKIEAMSIFIQKGSNGEDWNKTTHEGVRYD